METINKLLKKQAPKTTKKAAAAQAAEDPVQEGEVEVKPSPMFIRWVSNKDGTQIGVPSEVLDGPVGKPFRGGKPAGPPRPRPIIEEVS